MIFPGLLIMQLESVNSLRDNREAKICSHDAVNLLIWLDDKRERVRQYLIAHGGRPE